MFNPAISPPSGAGPRPPGPERPPSSGFASALSEARQALEPTPDPRDEAAALQEKFRILYRLSLGLVDPALLKAKEGGEAPAGPARMEVETLKQLLRRLRRGGAAEGRSDDPQEPSLSALFQALPSEIRNLLLRAFPWLQEALQMEAQRS